MKLKFLYVCIVFFTTIHVKGQNKDFIIPDSLKEKSFKELRDAFFDNDTKIEIAKIYGNSYLQKGKDINNTDTIAEGYHMLAYLEEDFKIAYFDSIINLKYNKINKRYPTTAFWEKGAVLSNYNTKLALENYLLGIEAAKKSNNIHFEQAIEYNIGLLKSLIGENKDALRIFKKCYQFRIDYDYQKRNNNDFLNTLFGLADAFRRNNILDSASYYNKMGAKDAYLHKNTRMKTYFILNEGANKYIMGNDDNTAIDSIQKAIPLLKEIKDSYNLGIAYFYLGELYFKENKKDLGVQYLQKMDSIIQKTTYLMPEERKGYETLIRIYKNKKNIKKQLFYTERLIQADSLLKSYHQNLSKDLALEYDIPKLIHKKEILINTLKKDAKKNTTYIFGVLIVLFIMLFAFLFNLKKQRVLKTKFKALVSKLETKKQLPTPIQKKEPLQTDLSKDIVEILLTKLVQFEKDLGFLEQKLTLTKLAKKIETNSSYLSKVINQHKEQTFSVYLADLRVNYAMVQLKENKVLRKYTVKAIAKEFGFNTAESFSTAFHKKTGIYPSYFIKQLKKQNI